MKTLKYADQAGQLLIAAGGLLFLWLTNRIGSFIWLYYVLGAWQVSSFVIHLFIGHSWVARKSRRHYGTTLAGIIIVLLVSLLMLMVEIPFLIFVLGALFFIAPVLGTWYFFIGWEELKTIRGKELIHLK